MRIVFITTLNKRKRYNTQTQKKENELVSFYRFTGKQKTVKEEQLSKTNHKQSGKCDQRKPGNKNIQRGNINIKEHKTT